VKHLNDLSTNVLQTLANVVALSRKTVAASIRKANGRSNLHLSALISLKHNILATWKTYHRCKRILEMYCRWITGKMLIFAYLWIDMRLTNCHTRCYKCSGIANCKSNLSLASVEYQLIDCLYVLTPKDKGKKRSLYEWRLTHITSPRGTITAAGHIPRNRISGSTGLPSLIARIRARLII